MIYGVVFEDADDGGVGAYVPDMPGVAVVAGTRAEAAQMLDRAVQWHVAGMIEDGTPLPDPSKAEGYDFFVILDRTYVQHVEDAMLPYILNASNATPFWIQSRSSFFDMSPEPAAT
ncbi:MAG: type II toxin-antitoxin system HicB family antitoxin [Vulcanimicrobiaceae bacterium]